MTFITLFTISFITIFFSELYVVKKFSKQDGKADNKNSNSMLLLSTLLLFICAGVLNLLQIGFEKNLTLSLTGLFLTFVGVFYRQYAIFVLGQFFNKNIRIKDEHSLIQHGPYRYFRHPSYFGSLVMFFGIGLTTSNVICYFLFPTIISLNYIYRTKVEETLLTEHFGKTYIEYKTKTWGFIPWIR